MLIGMNVPLGQLYLYAALPLVISLVACIMMIRLHDTANKTTPGEVALSH